MNLAVNTRKTKYIKTGHPRGMIENEHITVGSNFFEKVNTIKYLGSLAINKIIYKM